MSDRQSTDTVPAIDTDEWTLTVTGAVEWQLELSVEDFQRMPLEPFTGDLACREGWKREGLTWRGVRVRDLFRLAELAPESRHALVRGMDDEYACSFGIGRLGDAMVAVERDGDQLPVEHGGPVRLVPTDSDRDCWEHVKWLTEIEVRERELRREDTARELTLSRSE